jgi:hypothetical protein
MGQIMPDQIAAFIFGLILFAIVAVIVAVAVL